jgi:hypothetical protein
MQSQLTNGLKDTEFLNIDDTAEICAAQNSSWKVTQLLGLGLAETLGVPNTITVGNSLSFSMVYNTALNG